MKYSQMPQDMFKHIQMNAGILAKSFTPTSGEVTKSDIIGATSGGINFTATPSFTDFGEDIDNCPNNMKELKKLDSWEAKASGTFISVTVDAAGSLVGAADVAGDKVTPRNDLADDDFEDLWIIGDYSEINEDGSTGKAGFIAIHMLNSLSTGGFQIQTSKKAKGQFAFEYTAHYSMEDPDKVPFELYVKQGTADAA